MRTYADKLQSYHKDIRSQYVEKRKALLRNAQCWVQSYSEGSMRQLLTDLANKLRYLENDDER